MPPPDLSTISTLRGAIARADEDVARLQREIEGLRQQRALNAAHGASSEEIARAASREAVAEQRYREQIRERSALRERLMGGVSGVLYDRPEESVSKLDRALPVVLLPVRLETRFVGTKLHVRIYPDQIHIHQHDAELTHDEVAAAKRYWQAIWPNTGAAPEAWRQLLSEAAPERAAWLVDALRPSNSANRGMTDEPVFPTVTSVERRVPYAAHARLLPTRWAVTLLAHDGKRMVRKWAPHPVAEPLSVSPFGTLLGEFVDVEGAPPGIDKAAHWMFDFARAVEAGMALTIEESELEYGNFSNGIGSVIATAVDWSRAPEDAGALLADQLRAHGYSDGFEFLEPGLVTSNTARSSSGFQSSDSRRGTSFAPEPPLQAEPQSAAACLAELLGVDNAVFARFPGASSRYDVTAAQLHAALYGAAFGFYFSEVLYPIAGRGQFGSIRDHVTRFLRPAGPYATIRVGKQPYGVLPVLSTAVSTTNLTALASRPAGFATTLTVTLAKLRHLLETQIEGSALDEVRSLSAVPTGVQPEDLLAEILKQSPLATGTFVRPIGGVESLFLTKTDLEAARKKHEEVVGTVLGAVTGALDRNESMTGLSARFYLDDDNTLRSPLIFELFSPEDPRYSLRALPWVSKDLGSNDAVASAVSRVRERIDAAAGDASNTKRFLAVAAGDASTLFEALLLLSAAFEYWRAAEDEVRRPEFEAHFDGSMLTEFTGIEAAPAASAPTRTVLTTPRQLLQVATPNPGGEAVSLFKDIRDRVAVDTGPRLREAREFHAAITELLARPANEIDHALRGLLDSGSHRLDAWITSVATRRLHSQRSSRPRGVHIGGFGYVHDLRRDVEPTSEGFVHVPSTEHAVMSAVLRAANMANRDDKPDAFAVRLTSKRVRDALYVTQGMSRGQDPAALLGYRFERRLIDSRTEARFINAFRRLAPQPDVISPAGPAESIGARDVVDGVKLAELWREKKQQLFADVGALAIPPVSVSTEQAQKLSAHLKYLIDLVDSFNDLWTAESVYQLVRGNQAGEAAALAVLDRQERPPEPECVQTPRKCWGYSQRVLCAQPVAAVGTGWPADLVSRIEPGANQLAAAWLGDPQRFRFSVDGTNTSVGTDDLGLSPLSIVMLSARAGSQKESRLTQRINEQLSRSVTSGASFEARGVKEFAALANAVRRALFDRVALSQRDFTPPTGPIDSRIDVDAVTARATELEQELQDCEAELTAATGAAPDQAQLLVALERAAQIVPVEAPADLDELINECVSARARIARILEQWRATTVAPPTTGPGAAEVARQSTLELALNRIRLVFGSGFPVLPPFKLDSSVRQEWQLNLDRQAALFADRSRLAPVQWIRTMSQVRPRMRSLALALDAAAWSGHSAGAGATSVAQFPYDAKDSWVALPFPGEPPKHVRMSALLFGEVAPADTAMIGVLIDEWTEAIPEASTTTSVAFHHDAPGARPPQTLCVAVDAGVTQGGWSTDSLVETVLELIDLSKVRLLKPDQLPGAGAMLPTTFIPRNLAAEVPSLDLLGIALSEAQVVSATVLGKG